MTGTGHRVAVAFMEQAMRDLTDPAARLAEEYDLPERRDDAEPGELRAAADRWIVITRDLEQEQEANEAELRTTLHDLRRRNEARQASIEDQVQLCRRRLLELWGMLRPVGDYRPIRLLNGTLRWAGGRLTVHTNTGAEDGEST